MHNGYQFEVLMHNGYSVGHLSLLHLAISQGDELRGSLVTVNRICGHSLHMISF